MIQTFERLKIGPNKLYGVVVAESAQLLLIHSEYDFEFDGYVVIRRQDVTKSYPSKSNDYGAAIMKKEGRWKSPSKAARSLPLTDWKTLLKALLGKFVIVENERTGDFFIGPIVGCGARSVAIHHFDACGVWEKIVRVPFSRITSVGFANRYIQIHSRHLPPRPKKSVARKKIPRRSG